MLTDTYAVGSSEQQTYTYELQASGNLPLSVTDQLGRRTTFIYDSLGNPTGVTGLAGTPEAVTTAVKCRYLGGLVELSDSVVVETQVWLIRETLRAAVFRGSVCRS